MYCVHELATKFYDNNCCYERPPYRGRRGREQDLRTDILLVTVTEVEAQAVLNLFAEETKKTFQRHYIDDKTYFDLDMINGAHIMMVQSEMGAGWWCTSGCR